MGQIHINGTELGQGPQTLLGLKLPQISHSQLQTALIQLPIHR